MDNQWVLLMGAGDLATRLQPLLDAQGFDVAAARRSPPKNAPFPHMKADACDVRDWQKILAHRPKVIVMTMVPTEFSDEGYRQGYVLPVQGLLQALEGEQGYRPFVMFVSSTSVYSERQGQWVTEESPTQPDSFSGKRLLEAETLLRESGLPHVVVRFSGIYGPGREAMVARLISSELTITPAWTNRIHVRDCVGVMSHLIGRYQAGLPLDEVYLASDNLPIRQQEFVSGLAEILGIDADGLPRSEQVGPRGSKRCSNARLLETGYRFIFPTWKEGYESL